MVNGESGHALFAVVLSGKMSARIGSGLKCGQTAEIFLSVIRIYLRVSAAVFSRFARRESRPGCVQLRPDGSEINLAYFVRK